MPEINLVESTDCPICGAADARTLFVARDRLLGRPGEFPIVRCVGCRLEYLRPRPAPAALATYYPDSYYPLHEEASPEARTVAEGLLAHVTRWAREYRETEPTILDIGCGTGLFLHLAQKAGMRVRGIEPGESAVAYARATYGLDVQCGALEDNDLPDKAVDIVTMWNVLEHLPDPIAALRQVVRVLTPGGLLLVGVPNVESVEARVFGRRWYSLDAPRHLYHFAPETLTAAFVVAGLTPQLIVHSTGTAGLVYSVMGDLTGISLRARGRPLSDTSYNRVANILHRVATPLCIGAARIGRGGALEAYATKASER